LHSFFDVAKLQKVLCEVMKYEANAVCVNQNTLNV